MHSVAKIISIMGLQVHFLFYEINSLIRINTVQNHLTAGKHSVSPQMVVRGKEGKSTPRICVYFSEDRCLFLN